MSTFTNDNMIALGHQREMLQIMNDNIRCFIKHLKDENKYLSGENLSMSEQIKALLEENMALRERLDAAEAALVTTTKAD